MHFHTPIELSCTLLILFENSSTLQTRVVHHFFHKDFYRPNYLASHELNLSVQWLKLKRKKAFSTPHSAALPWTLHTTRHGSPVLSTARTVEQPSRLQKARIRLLWRGSSGITARTESISSTWVFQSFGNVGIGLAVWLALRGRRERAAGSAQVRVDWLQQERPLVLVLLHCYSLQLGLKEMYQ